MEKNERFPNLMRVLREYGQSARDEYRKKLKEEGKVASGDLLYNTEFEVRIGDKNISVGLNLAYYWKFVEGGTKGSDYPNALCKQHKPPVGAIIEWIKVKPVIPRPMENGKLPTIRQLGFAIRESIGKKGIKPAPMLKETSEDVYKKFKARLEEAFKIDVQDSLYRELTIFNRY